MSLKSFLSPKYYGPAMIAIAATLWALDGLLRTTLYVLPPIAIVFYEHLFGALLLSPFIIKPLLKEKITRNDWIVLFAVSILSSLLGTLFFTSALVKVNFISISVVFLLQKLQPLFATTSAALLLKEKVTKPFLAWGGLAVAAAYFVTFPGGVVNFSTGDQTTMAALLAVGAAACWGVGTTLSRMFLINHNPQVATGLRFSITTILALLLIPILTGASEIPALTTPQLTSLGMIAVSTGMVAMTIYYQGLKYTQAKISTIVELIFPVLGVLIDANKKTILGWFGISDPYITNTILAPTQFVTAAVLLFAIYKVGTLNKAAETTAKV